MKNRKKIANPFQVEKNLAPFRDLRQRILSSDRHLDKFLSEIAGGHPTHAFLGKATQTVYQRQVILLRELADRFFPIPTSKVKVLDWGAGKGHISYLLAKEGFQVTSCDLKDHSDDSSFGQETPILSRKKIRVIPLEQEARLPFKDATFEIVVSFGVLEHVRKDEISAKEILRILKPGGIFFITFLPYFLSWTQLVARLKGDDYHDRLYSERGLRDLASKTGFTVLDLWHGQFFPKNSIGNSTSLEKLDRFLTDSTPLRYLATNLEAVLVKPLE